MQLSNKINDYNDKSTYYNELIKLRIDIKDKIQHMDVKTAEKLIRFIYLLEREIFMHDKELKELHNIVQEYQRHSAKL